MSDLKAAVDAHQSGRLAEAEAGYRAVLAVEPDQPFANNLLGILLNATGRGEEAVPLLERAVALRPQNGEFHNNLGEALRLSGRFAEAVGIFDRALELLGPNPAVYGNRGAAAARAGDNALAEESFRKAVELQPDAPLHRFNLGTFLKRQGDLEGARVAFEAAIERDPAYAAAHNNLGNVLKDLGDISGASRCYREAIRHNPRLAAAHDNLGSALSGLGQSAEAVEHLRKAAELSPADASTLNNLANALKQAGKSDEAVEQYRHALARDPGLRDAYHNLGNALSEEGHAGEACAVFAEGFALTGDDGLDFKRRTMLPVIPGTEAEIAEVRERLAKELDAMARDGLRIDDPLRQIGHTMFFLAYHDRNDRELMSAAGDLLAASCPSLNHVAAHVENPGTPRDRLRIGFVSSHFRNHTIAKLMHAVIGNLPDKRFETRVYNLWPGRDDWSEKVRASADRYETLPGDLTLARQRLEAAELDILFYPDIGMEPTTYFLGFSRLAPVQAMTWGHPETSGIPALDLFFSGTDLEPEGSDDHYRERLVRLNGLPTSYEPPQLPDGLGDRAHFGFPEDRNIYLCPQSLFKIHPAFDPVLAEIVGSDPDAEIVFIAGAHDFWTEALKTRFARLSPDLAARTRFMPFLSGEDFFRLISVADVMLDPIHFSGGNTSFEGFATGTPIVTMAGRFMRSRVTYAMYRQMGLDACIAKDAGDYARLAVETATNRGIRNDIRNDILAARNALYGVTSSVQQMGRELEAAFGAAIA